MKKNNNLLAAGIWKNRNYKIDNLFLTKNLIKKYISLFWNEIMYKLSDKQYVIFVFKIKYNNGLNLTLCNKKKINNKNFNEIILNCYNILKLRIKEYKTFKISEIIISYKIIIISDKKLSLKNILYKNIYIFKLRSLIKEFYKFFYYNLPKNMNYNNFFKLDKNKNNKILNNQNKNSDNKYKLNFNKINVLNFNAFIFLAFITYKFCTEFNFDSSFLSLIFSFLISFVISNFILNKFKYSENIYIRFIQKFIIYNIIFTFVIIFAFYFLSLFNLIPTIYSSSGDEFINNKIIEDNTINKDKDILKVTNETDATNKDYYSFKISKNLVNNTLQNVNLASQTIFNNIVPNLGSGSAAGAAAAATIKATNGLPPLQRAGLVSGASLLTATSTNLGINIGNVLSKNINIKETIKNSSHANSNPDRIPSPEPSFINSTLENTIGEITSPLQDLLMYSFALDIITLLFNLIILLIIFNRYIYSFNLNFINFIITKYISIKIKNWYNKHLNTNIDDNNKFVLFMFIFNSIFLVLVIFLKIFLSS